MQTLATHVPDSLLGGDLPVVTKPVTILTGVGVILSRGTVLGKITLGTIPTTGTAAGGNTGTGAMGSVAAKRRTKVGTYTVTCIATATNKGQFEVVNPDGVLKGIAIVAVAYSDDELGFTISDATDFVVGDSFTVVIPTGSNKFAKVDKDNINGTGVAVGVLAETVDASAADVEAIMYTTGMFNKDALVFGTGDVFADHEADLLKLGIQTKVAVA